MLTWSVFESFWPLVGHGIEAGWRTPLPPTWELGGPPGPPTGVGDPRQCLVDTTIRDGEQTRVPGDSSNLAGNRLTAPPLFLEQRPQRVGVDHRAAGAPMPHGCSVLPAAGPRVFPSVLATNLRHAQSSQDSNSGPLVPSDYKQRDAARCVWPAKRPIWTAARCTQMQPAEPSPYAHGTRAQLVSVGVTRSWAKRNSSSLSRPRP